MTFRWKEYRAKGKTRYNTMTLGAGEFMRRFLLHVLPGGFHRIRHYGLLANGARTANPAQARALLNHAPAQHPQAADADTGRGAAQPCFVCRHCGGPLFIVETFARGQTIRAPPQPHAS